LLRSDRSDSADSDGEGSKQRPPSGQGRRHLTLTTLPHFRRNRRNIGWLLGSSWYKFRLSRTSKILIHRSRFRLPVAMGERVVQDADSRSSFTKILER